MLKGLKKTFALPREYVMTEMSEDEFINRATDIIAGLKAESPSPSQPLSVGSFVEHEAVEVGIQTMDIVPQTQNVFQGGSKDEQSQENPEEGGKRKKKSKKKKSGEGGEPRKGRKEQKPPVITKYHPAVENIMTISTQPFPYKFLIFF